MGIAWAPYNGEVQQKSIRAVFAELLCRSLRSGKFVRSYGYQPGTQGSSECCGK